MRPKQVTYWHKTVGSDGINVLKKGSS